MFYEETLIFASGGRSNYRIPSMVVTNKGTLLAFTNDRKDTASDSATETALSMCRKEVDGKWGEVIDLSSIPGWGVGLGSAVYDTETERVFVFGGRSAAHRNEFQEYTPEQLAEMRRKTEEEAARLGVLYGEILFISDDDGVTFYEKHHTPIHGKQLHWDGKEYDIGCTTHGSAHGIQLRHGKYKGRLLCPCRTNIGKCASLADLFKCTYNNAMYSDDHGETWHIGSCVQVGTGEGTLFENQDGTITYNSRAYYKDGKRYIATSTDGGESWHDFYADDFLLEEKNIGCNASLVRVELDEIKDKSMLPADAEGVTVFCNPRAVTRDNMCACVSFDAGKTWSHVKQIYPHHASYSSLVWNPVNQHFALLHERGTRNAVSDGLAVVEFDLEWLLSE